MNNNFTINPYDKVLIIGNGFDLDLGLATRYSDFASKSDFFNVFFLNSELNRHLQNASTNEKWLDMELELEKYAQREKSSYSYSSDYYVDKDRTAFVQLKQDLTNYLIQEQEKQLNKDSLAAKLLKAVYNCGLFKSIYSFNYTDLFLFAEKLGIDSHLFNIYNVHGSLKKNDIILGVREGAELKPGYDFLRKSFSQNYSSYPIPYDLQEAGEVVFFGHSLSPNDYHYFSYFFERQCDESMRRTDAKRITFFTYDENSAIDIKRQLWEMNKHRTDRLFTQNDVIFIYTKNPDDSAYNDLFDSWIENVKVPL